MCVHMCGYGERLYNYSENQLSITCGHGKQGNPRNPWFYQVLFLCRRKRRTERLPGSEEFTNNRPVGGLEDGKVLLLLAVLFYFVFCILYTLGFAIDLIRRKANSLH